MKKTTFIENFLALFSYEATDCQKLAIEVLADFLAVKNPKTIFLLTGYAGTGKTTFISVFVDLLKNLGGKSVLMAPTGRAAKVMSVYAKVPAYTLHKKIYSMQVNKEGRLLIKLRPNLHCHTIFIVDEASMISASTYGSLNGRNLLEDVFLFVESGKNCKLILVGDNAQLPPVGEDYSPALIPNVLTTEFYFDVLHANLQTVVRQSEDSGVLFNATALRQQIISEKVVFPMFQTEGFSDFKSITGESLRDILDAAYSQSDIHDVIVLCNSNKRANLYNQHIRQAILFRETEIAAGDIMMVCKNNYFWLPDEHSAHFIANGDMIEIMRINRIYELYGFRFADVGMRLCDYQDDIVFDTTLLLNTINSETPALSNEDNRKLYDEVLLDYTDIPLAKDKRIKMRENPHINALQVKFAYAITVHKAQGGQWDTVFIDYGYIKDEQMDVSFLRWLYTALTRANRQVYLVNFNALFFNY